MHKLLNLRKGINLTELVIVLAIIGLLIVAIMKSGELIDKAKSQRLMRELIAIKQAVDMFETIYEAIPGDFDNGFAYWGADCAADATTCNGNADGNISDSDKSSNDSEARFFFKHLSLADILTKGNYNPTSATITDAIYDFSFVNYDTSGIAYYPTDTTNYPEGFSNWLHVGSDLDSLGAFIEPKWMNDIDTKIDDGLPTDGIITIYANTSTPDGTYLTCTGTNATDTGNNYFLGSEDLACNMLYDLNH